MTNSISPPAQERVLWIAEAIHELGDRAPLIEIAARVANKAYKAGATKGLDAHHHEVATIGSIETSLGFGFAYSKLARHISAAQCLQEGLSDTDLSTREKSLLGQICEAYEFIQLFEKMMTTVQFRTNDDPIATTSQPITAEDFRRVSTPTRVSERKPSCKW